MSELANPEPVYALYEGIFKPQLARMAIELDVFTPLAAGPATAREIALACGCSAYGMQTLLDYLCAIQILNREGEQYALTQAAETFLVRGRKAYAGDMLLHYTSPELFESILGSIRSGQPANLGENFVQDAWLESYSPWRIPRSLEMWQATGIQVSPDKEFRLLDLACGCAIKSLALAQAFSSVKVTGLDSAEVLEVARDLAGRMGLTERVTLQPADILLAELGENQYDAALLGQITFYLTPVQNLELFKRLYRALSRGGTLVLDCAMLSSQLQEFASFASLFFWANSGGTAYPFTTYQDWLREVGFQQVVQVGERWTVARKKA